MKFPALSRPGKAFILIQLLDLLTTMVGICYFGLWEGNPMYAGWCLERLIVLKMLYTGMIVIILEMPFDYGWLKWVPVVISIPPVPWNIYMIWSVL